MAEVRTNLRVIKVSRKGPKVGDVFVMQIPDETYLFGRVVGAELVPPDAPMPKSILIYVFNQQSRTKEINLDSLTPDRLLIPPVFINAMPWTKGYFQTVAHQEISEEHLLSQHCFWSAPRSRYLDEHGKILTREIQPCGDWALSSYRSLDDRVSDALDIPRVPDETGRKL